MLPVILLRVIVIKSHHRDFTGQCLEHDFCVQGDTLDKLKAAFEAMLYKQLEISVTRGLKPLAHLPKSPKHFYEMYFDAIQLPFIVRPPNGRVRADFAILI